MNILAIESSCDETAAAVIKDGTKILSNVVASSTAMHEKWGGIVPEVAAREQLKAILPVITEALDRFLPEKAGDARRGTPKKGSPCGYSWGKTRVRTREQDIKRILKNNIDAIAITVGPGLIGSLLIGVETAKTLSFVTGKPLIPVNHVLAHMYANFLESAQGNSSRVLSTSEKSRGNIIRFPAISLVVSGGHTELFLMTNPKELTWLGGTIDDAAGEAFDKSARLLGFGHGGGKAIENAIKNSELRITNEKSHIQLPRPMMHDDSLNFSFSGLKTAILREVQKLKNQEKFNESTIQQLAYEVQEAITDVLVSKTIKAVKLNNAKSIFISGGVASNVRLREKMKEAISRQLPAIRFFAPEVQYCTDNAAYIASYAFFRGKPVDWHDVTAIPDMTVEV